MTRRKLRPIFDDLTPQSSYRLDMSLADFLPDTKCVRLGTIIRASADLE